MKPDQIKQFFLTTGYHLTFTLIISMGLGSFSFAEEVARASIQSTATSLNIDHIDGSKVFFKSISDAPPPAPLETHLYDLVSLGKLQTHGETKALPYFLFSGRTCQDCSTDKGIFALRPNGDRPASYTYPGRTIDPKTRQVVLESRAFFGRCLAGRGDVLIYFQLERVDRRRSLQPSVFVAEAKPDHLEDFLFERRTPQLKNTLRQVKAGVCKEIPGETRQISHPSINIHVAPSSIAPRT